MSLRVSDTAGSLRAAAGFSPQSGSPGGGLTATYCTQLGMMRNTTSPTRNISFYVEDEASCDVLGTSLEPLGSLLAASWGSLGASLGPLGALLGLLGEVPGRSWEHLGRSSNSGDRALLWNASWKRLGAVLELSWGCLGAVLGRAWLLLGSSWGLLGALGAVLEPSCGISGQS